MGDTSHPKTANYFHNLFFIDLKCHYLYGNATDYFMCNWEWLETIRVDFLSTWSCVSLPRSTTPSQYKYSVMIRSQRVTDRKIFFSQAGLEALVPRTSMNVTAIPVKMVGLVLISWQSSSANVYRITQVIFARSRYVCLSLLTILCPSSQ